MKQPTPLRLLTGSRVTRPLARVTGFSVVLLRGTLESFFGLCKRHCTLSCRRSPSASQYPAHPLGEQSVRSAIEQQHKEVVGLQNSLFRSGERGCADDLGYRPHHHYLMSYLLRIPPKGSFDVTILSPLPVKGGPVSLSVVKQDVWGAVNAYHAQ